MDSGSDDRRVPEAGPIAEEGGGKADSGPLADAPTTWRDAEGRFRWILRANFYSYDENDNERYCGAIVERGGRLVAEPAGDPRVQQILSQPLELDGETIPPSEVERFLTNLHLRYTDRDFAASRLHRQHPGIVEEGGGIADWDKPSEAEAWERERKLDEFLAELESEKDDSSGKGDVIRLDLPPIPAWMRKGPRPKSAQRELFDRD